jgi:hypothetical protein
MRCAECHGASWTSTAAAAQAPVEMPARDDSRLPDDDLCASAHTAAREADTAIRALGGILDYLVPRLSLRALIDLARRCVIYRRPGANVSSIRACCTILLIIFIKGERRAHCMDDRFALS